MKEARLGVAAETDGASTEGGAGPDRRGRLLGVLSMAIGMDDAIRSSTSSPLRRYVCWSKNSLRLSGRCFGVSELIREGSRVDAGAAETGPCQRRAKVLL